MACISVPHLPTASAPSSVSVNISLGAMSADNPANISKPTIDNRCIRAKAAEYFIDCLISKAVSGDVPRPTVAIQTDSKVAAVAYNAPSPLPPFENDLEEPLPICIIGAGAAGLYTAMILDSLDIRYEILDASERVGGRLYTHRFNGEEGRNAPLNDPKRYQYCESQVSPRFL